MRVFLIAVASAVLAWGQTNEPLRLEKTIELPDVRGRIDHMSIDVQGQRLFVSTLSNNTLEVIDVKAGKRLKTITGLAEPHGGALRPRHESALRCQFEGRKRLDFRRKLMCASQYA